MKNRKNRSITEYIKENYKKCKLRNNNYENKVSKIKIIIKIYLINKIMKIMILK